MTMDYGKWTMVNERELWPRPDEYHYAGVIASEDYPNHLFGNRSTLIMLMNMPDHTYVTLTLHSPVHLLANQKLISRKYYIISSLGQALCVGGVFRERAWDMITHDIGRKKIAPQST